MRSNLVVVTPVLLDDNLRIDSVSEPLHAQALIAELPVEGFVVAVLPGLAWIDVRGINVRLGEPLQNSSRYELRTVVGTQVLGAAVNADQLAQHLNDSSGSNAPGYVDRQALAAKLIYDRQALDLLPLAQASNTKS